MKSPIWSYGVTTIPARLNDLLPRTLDSLKAAGFPTPRLFVDGSSDASLYKRFGLPMTFHDPALNGFGNWITTLVELYIRQPLADYFCIFQDDIVLNMNTREYIEESHPPDVDELVYLNLFTCFLDPPGRQAAPPSEDFIGWYPSNQLGRGALALVFNRRCLHALLSSKCIVEKPTHAGTTWRGIDAAVADALTPNGFTELIHSPSLVQHLGEQSSLRSAPQKPSDTFYGEDYDALNYLFPQELLDEDD